MRYVLLLAIILWSSFAQAQTITSAEEFEGRLVLVGSSFGTLDLNKVEWSTRWLDKLEPGAEFLRNSSTNPVFGTYGCGADITGGGSPYGDGGTNLSKLYVANAGGSALNSIYARNIVGGGGTQQVSWVWRAPAAWDSLYVSFRHKYNPVLRGPNPTSYKMFRFNDSGTMGVDTPEYYYSMDLLPGSLPASHGWIIYCNLRCEYHADACLKRGTTTTNVVSTTHPREILMYLRTANGAVTTYDNVYPLPNTWNRQEFLWVASSDFNEFDGELHHWIQRGEEPMKHLVSAFDMVTSRSVGYVAADSCISDSFDGWVGNGVNEMDTVVWQCHFDDRGGPFIGEVMETWIQDVFIQEHTQKRVEVANDPVYANATKRAPQYPTVWTDSYIELTPNLALFDSSEDLYVYVIAHDGTVSSPVALNSSPTGPTVDLSIYSLMAESFEERTASRYRHAPSQTWQAIYPNTTLGSNYEWIVTTNLTSTPAESTYTGDSVPGLVMLYDFVTAADNYFRTGWIDEDDYEFYIVYGDSLDTRKMIHRKRDAIAGFGPSGWSTRISVVADSSLVGSGTFASMPLLVDLANAPSIFWERVAVDGKDIAFTSTDDTLQLAYQLVEFDSVARTGHAWVKPTTFSKTDNSFYLYCGNSSAVSRSSSDVWENFEGVYHYEDYPIGSLFDNSGRGNHATLARQYEADAWLMSHRVPGKVGNAWEYAVGRTAYNRTMKTDSDSWTISAWVYVTEAGSNYMFQGKEPWFWVAPTITSGGDAFYQSSLTTQIRTEAEAVLFNTWQHVAFVMDGGTDDVRVYVNGILSPWREAFDVPEGFAAHAIDCPRERCGVGSVMYPNRASAGNDHFDGWIDELHVMNGVATQGWIKTQYNNTNDNSAFWAWSAVVPGAPTTTPTRKLQIQD